jgi:hypothetical protein
MALQSEPVTYRQSADPKLELDRCGATADEQAFLVGMQQHNPSTGQAYWTGQRVELNAMTSDQFVAWLERRLTEHGVTKVIPTPDTLAKTYRLAMRTRAINTQLAQLQETMSGQLIDLPDDLVTRVSAALQESPKLSWEAAIWNVVQGHEADA